MTAKKGNASPKNAVFATCLADTLRPQVVEATCNLVKHCSADNLTPILPSEQTCCGQPLYNSGDRNGAIQQAMRVIDLFGEFDAIVVPSGSCAGMLKWHYPSLLQDTPYAQKAKIFKEKIWELTEFLAKFLTKFSAKKPLAIKSALTWHDSCSCLRENNSESCARALLKRRGFTLRESTNREVCCGFGGKFSLRHSAISTSMADDKIKSLQASGASIVAGADLGCLLHLAGRARRRALPLSFFHIAELLVEQINNSKSEKGSPASSVKSQTKTSRQTLVPIGA